MFDAEFQALRLSDLAEQDVLVDVLRQARRGKQQVVTFVFGVVFVVPVQGGTVQVALLLGNDAPQRLCHRRRVHAEFADEPAGVLGVATITHRRRCIFSSRLFAEAAGIIAVPDLPVVDVALLATVVVVAAIRRAGPVRSPAVQLGNRARQYAVVVQRAIRRRLGGIPVLAVVQPLVFVVSTP